MAQGKQLFIFNGEEGFIIKTLPFINADIIVKNELGGYS